MLILFGVGIIRGWLVPGFIHTREVTRADKLQEELRERWKTSEERLLPTLARVAEEMAQARQERELERERERWRRESGER